MGTGNAPILSQAGDLLPTVQMHVLEQAERKAERLTQHHGHELLLYPYFQQKGWHIGNASSQTHLQAKGQQVDQQELGFPMP